MADRIVEHTGEATARQRRGKHVSTVTNQHATVGSGVFCVVHAEAI
jgi:hypothetical protein